MAMTAQLWSINGLMAEVGRDRRVLSQALREIQPDGKTERGHDGWYTTTALRALSVLAGGSADGEVLDKNAELTRKAKEEADKLEMENAVRRGELREAADVDAAVISAFARVRSKLLGLPSKLAPKVITSEDANEAEAEISAGIREVLRELSETNVAELEADDSDMVEGVNAAA